MDGTSSLARDEAVVSCVTAKAKEWAWSSNVVSLPKGIAVCMTAMMETGAGHGGDAAYDPTFGTAERKCGFPTENGTFKHFSRTPSTFRQAMRPANRAGTERH
jgi:hypothetical protein